MKFNLVSYFQWIYTNEEIGVKASFDSCASFSTSFRWDFILKVQELGSFTLREKQLEVLLYTSEVLLDHLGGCNVPPRRL